MSPWLLFTATGLAMFAALLIHLLHRGARRELVVASLKPFERVNRPRLTLSRVRQKLLLASRLALLAAVLAALWLGRPVDSARSFSGDVVAVVPGTPASAWQALEESGSTAVWLNDSLSPAQLATAGGGNVAAALIQLDQLMRAGASLTVVGDLPAAHWPGRMPRLSREVRWVAADNARDAAERAWPESVYVVGGSAALRQRVMDSIGLWQRAGALDAGVRIREVEREGFSWPDAPVAVLWLAGEATPPARVDQALVHVTPDPPPTASADRVYADGALSTSALATRLWYAMTRLPAQRPVPAADVAPLTTAPTPMAGAIVQPRSVARMSPWLLCLLVGLFIVERGLSLRAPRS